MSTGHNVIINTNYGTKPRDYGVSTNVNGNNNNTYIHTGDITIAGNLSTNSTAFMITGEVDVTGSLTIDGDFFTTGILNINPTAIAFSIADDFILAGSSETNIDINAESADDIYLDGPNSILCGSDTFNLQNGNSSKINEFNGADMANQICASLTITGCDICPFNGLLPIELVYFKAIVMEEGIEIQWATIKELNNDYFTLEKSHDGINWKPIKKIEGKGNSITLEKYTILDRDPFYPLNYFRLKQTDIDGSSSYSEIISIHFYGDHISNLLIYPNPTEDIIHISGLPPFDDILSIQFTNLSGAIILEFKPEWVLGNVFNLNLDSFNLTKGIYLIKIITKTGILKEKVLYK
ncbi:T9SS type A sorting domain-containing protein [Flexithrix dorotheae]|uniref:T9SS type A sorting domain-containing protein n=1 Tax=Flexithrix dorotheae TaxID=70993 RepID=UPI001FDF6FA6|nr:T9SS type A sorting domain-containing protein [Flexithrix dorotheae]